MIIDKYTLLKSLIGLIQQVNVLMNKIVTIWNPSGLPSLPNLHRYETFAVADYGCMPHALHLRQTRQSLNLGLIILS